MTGKATPRKRNSAAVSHRGKPGQPAPSRGPTTRVCRVDACSLDFERDGALHLPDALTKSLEMIEAVLSALPTGEAGVRIGSNPSLANTVATAGVLDIARHWLGNNARAVRAILFDKTASTNWSLGWHQDRTICVRERREVPGFGPWTLKQGLVHVAPPFFLLEEMVTLRLHLDEVPLDNAPLLIALGSHLLGKIAKDQISAVVEAADTLACTAKRGDVWAYRTPILHASARANAPRWRRVLQIDFSAADLPNGLNWLGI